MAVVRPCVCLLFVLVQVAVSKPFFDGLLCDLVCADDDDSDESGMFDDMFGICADCPGPATTARPPQSISLKLPAAPNGISMNITDNNGVLQFILDALSLSGAAPATTAATAAAPGAPAAAPAAPAAPATTPAGNATAAG